MNNKLNEIITVKKREAAILNEKFLKNESHFIDKILTKKRIKNKFKDSLLTNEIAVIAEIKRRSPSKGNLAEISDPLKLAKAYAESGANALSILTDQQFFSGNLHDLETVAEQNLLPCLRKDFLVDILQIFESIIAGADAILLIVAVLGSRTRDFIATANILGINALVEVHTEAELETALEAGADIIGINNRDLTTFTLDMECALRLGEKVPAGIVKVAESGILSPEWANTYYQAEFNAVLIGEALVTAKDPAGFIKACKNVN